MSDWPTAPLGSLCNVVAGGTPKRSVPQYFDGDIPWVKINDLLQGNVKDTEEKITSAGLNSSSAKMLPKGTILISIFATIGRTAQLEIEACTNQAIAGLVIKNKSIAPSYLRYFLDSYSSTLKAAARGVAQLNINSSTLKSIKIPIPPLHEQERIVSSLESIDSLKKERHRSIELLDELTQSLFLDMFGDITKQTRWPLGTVSDLVNRFESGKSLASASDETISKHRILKISAVTTGTFKPQESKGAPPDHYPPEHHFARKGDLLFSRANTSELIGATAIVDSHHNNLLLPDKLWRFVWHEETRSNPLYVHHMFSQEPFRDAVRANSTGSSGSMKNISQKKVLTIPCALPPISTQEEFAEKARKIQEVKKQHIAHLSHLDELFASVQQRAFNGTLWDDSAVAS